MFRNGAGDYLVIDTKRGNRLRCWRHDDPEEPVISLGRDLTDLSDEFEYWLEQFQQAYWSCLEFDFAKTVMEELHPAALNWSRFSDLAVGALILGQSEEQAVGMLLVSSDPKGVVWLKAAALDRDGLWKSFEKQLRNPLPPPRERSDYEESMLSTTIGETARAVFPDAKRRVWFGYVPVTAKASSSS